MKKSGTSQQCDRDRQVFISLTDCEETKDGECRKEEVGSSVIKVGKHDRRYEPNDTEM